VQQEQIQTQDMTTEKLDMFLLILSEKYL